LKSQKEAPASSLSLKEVTQIRRTIQVQPTGFLIILCVDDQERLKSQKPSLKASLPGPAEARVVVIKGEKLMPSAESGSSIIEEPQPQFSPWELITQAIPFIGEGLNDQRTLLCIDVMVGLVMCKEKEAASLPLGETEPSTHRVMNLLRGDAHWGLLCAVLSYKADRLSVELQPPSACLKEAEVDRELDAAPQIFICSQIMSDLGAGAQSREEAEQEDDRHPILLSEQGA